MFLISNKLEELEFKLEKRLGLRNMQEKLEKICIHTGPWHIFGLSGKCQPMMKT